MEAADTWWLENVNTDRSSIERHLGTHCSRGVNINHVEDLVLRQDNDQDYRLCYLLRRIL